MLALLAPAAALAIPPEIEACKDKGALWLSDPDLFESTEIRGERGWEPVWQIRDRQGGRIGHLLVYPKTCRVVVLIVTPSSIGAPTTQVITPYNTQTTDAEHRMLRNWTGLISPIPAVCSQGGDTTGDGRPDHVQHYVYDDTSGGLTEVLTDNDGDGRIDHKVQFSLDAWGRPVSGPSGSCAEHYCSKTVTLQCPPGMACTTNALGLLEDMNGATGLHNDYSCWSQGPRGWTYTRPPGL